MNKLSFKKISIGTWMQLNDSNVAEILAASGYDWVTIDLEHGEISNDKLCDHIRAIELYKKLPFVRCKYSDQQNIQIVVEAGAKGIFLPQIKDSAHLKKLIKFAKLPPKGKRGIGFNRANLYGKNFNAYIKDTSTPYIIPIIENLDSLNDIDNILRVKNLDAIFIGPYDLSASLGITGEFKNKKYIDAINYILSKAKQNKVTAGIHVVHPSTKELKKSIKQGFKLIAYSMDSVFLGKGCDRPKI
tara:strand:+ start:481 stop:1212 length:732 start_codon:yes stop_codon:yes gene_type:complete